MSNQRQIIINEIDKAQSELGNLRLEEKATRKQEAYVTSLPMISGDNLAKKLEAILPSNLIPKNIGKIDEITWPYWYELDFDFSDGANATYNFGERKSSFFQIGQEAGFLLTHIYRFYEDSSVSGQGAPLEFVIKNVQSTRQFNDAPIQLQHIGTRGKPYKLPIPILLQPNEKLEIEMASWFGADFTVNGVSGLHSLSFMGRRVRMKDTLNMRADLIAQSR